MDQSWSSSGEFDCCGCRGKSKQQLNRATEEPIVQHTSTGPGSALERGCGIGVIFRMDTHGALVVDSLVPGGPAWESSAQGGLQVGDVLQTVDGKNVYRWPVSQLAPLLLGAEGTIVRIGVQRSLTPESSGMNGSANGQPSSSRDAVLRSLIVEIRRKRFSPPAEPFSTSRAPVVDARRGLGVKETVRPTMTPNTRRVPRIGRVHLCALSSLNLPRGLGVGKQRRRAWIHGSVKPLHRAHRQQGRRVHCWCRRQCFADATHVRLCLHVLVSCACRPSSAMRALRLAQPIVHDTCLSVVCSAIKV